MERERGGICDGIFPHYRQRQDLEAIREVVVFSPQTTTIRLGAEQLAYLLTQRQKLTVDASRRGAKLEGSSDEAVRYEQELEAACRVIGFDPVECVFTRTNGSDSAPISGDGLKRLFGHLDTLTIYNQMHRNGS